MTENNKRYIGEVFIDGESNKLLQEFLTNLFNSYQGHGNGFNADMVDDWHLDDILQYVDEGLATKLDYIKIGNTIFNKANPESFITLLDIIYDEFETMPWVGKIREKPDKYNRLDSTCLDDSDYLAADIVKDIYAVLDTDKADVSELAKLWALHDELRNEHDILAADFKKWKQRFQNVFRKIKILDGNGNEIEECLINADMVNGFRFIPITQAAYNALDVREKEFWRNIYIIVDKDVLDYEDPISFRVFQRMRFEYNPVTQYIDYYDGISTEPRPLISLVDLLKGANLNQQIKKYIEEASDIIYNPIALRESLKELVISESADAPDLPFLTKESAKVLASSITSTQGTITSARNSQNFTTFDISKAFDTKFSSIDSRISTAINTLNKSISDSTKEIREYVASNYVNNINYNKRVGDVESGLRSLRNQTSDNYANLDERVRRSSLRILIGRWSDKQGEFGTRIVSFPSDPWAGIRNGIYARVITDDPNFDYKQVRIVIDFNSRQYIFTHDEEMPGRKVVDAGLYKPFPNGPTYRSAMTSMLGVNQPDGSEHTIFAMARYGQEGFPSYAIKRIEVKAP